MSDTSFPVKTWVRSPLRCHYRALGDWEGPSLEVICLSFTPYPEVVGVGRSSDVTGVSGVVVDGGEPESRESIVGGKGKDKGVQTEIFP